MPFDAPTSALDPEMIQDVLDAMIDPAREGMTMIVMTHEMGFGRAVADLLVFMDHGEILHGGPTEAFFIDPPSERARTFLLCAR
jgi:ABC-type polar amino acid transport system ATPase subunit